MVLRFETTHMTKTNFKKANELIPQIVKDHITEALLYNEFLIKQKSVYGTSPVELTAIPIELVV